MWPLCDLFTTPAPSGGQTSSATPGYWRSATDIQRCVEQVQMQSVSTTIQSATTAVHPDLVSPLGAWPSDIHPAVEEDYIAALLRAADSMNPTVRLLAVRHARLPLAKAIMMQGDADPYVRATATKVVQWHEQTEKAAKK